MVVAPRDIVGKAYEALNARDMDGLLALLDEDVEWVNAPYAVEPGTRRGHDGFRTAVGNLWATFGDITFALGSVEEAGPRVLVQARAHATGLSGGSEVHGQRHHVWTLDAEKVVRFEWFNSRAEALAAAGAGER